MNFKESKAIYLQIADRICDEVLLGQYQEEERIPSVREYAAVVEVNANTVMRSYDYDKDDIAAAAAVAAVRAASGHEFFTVKAHRTVAALARVEPYRGDVDKVGLCCHTAPP